MYLDMDSSPGSMDEENNNREHGGGSVKRERTAAEIRKSNKPLMERKRRERINNCLQQLKSILMEVTKKESSYYSKLEKADILEMTVKYLKNMKRQQLAVAMGNDPSLLGKYIAGFNECTTEITSYLNSVEGLDSDTRSKLMNHLANSLQRSSLTMAAATTAVNSLQLNQSFGSASAQPLGIQIPTATQLSSLPGSGGFCVLNQNSAIQTIPASAMQLVPAKLPTGEVVFLLANPQTVSPSSGMSVITSVQNSVNITPGLQSQINSPVAPGSSGSPENTRTVSHFAFPGIPTISHMMLQSPTVSVSTNSTSGASTSGSSPDSDDSVLGSCSRPAGGRYAQRTSIETPHRPIPTRIATSRLCSPPTDTDSESDVNDDDIAHHHHARDATVLRGPMWRPW